MIGINLDQFYMGRDQRYFNELTDELRRNAAETVRRTNDLLYLFYIHNPTAKMRSVNSGWRPAAINGGIPGAATRSNHMVCKAVDLSDDDGALDAWLMSDRGQKALTEIGLWLEHPSATRGWCHVQISPPHSGNRVFNP